MQKIDRPLAAFAPFGPTIIRIVIGSLFVLHGFDKFSSGIGNVEAFFAANGVPVAGATAPLTAIAEIVLGAALVVGLFTRAAAIALAFIIVGAIAFVKVGSGILGGAELDLVYLAGLAGVALLGSGRLSADEVIRAESRSSRVAV